jgi:hypothetical protein
MKKYLYVIAVFQIFVMSFLFSSFCAAYDKPEPFDDFFARFIKAFNEKNSVAINDCINPDYGFFVLDNPGAFLVARDFKSFEEIMNLEGENDIAHLKVMKVECVYVKGKAPVYSCEEEKWNKEGCFLDKKPKLQISKIYKSMIEYQLGDENELKSKLELAKKSESKISHLVYSTNSNVGFYFGIVDGKWFLFCIDKITPCSA